MLRSYEIGLVLRADPSDDVINQTIEQIHTWIKGESAVVDEADAATDADAENGAEGESGPITKTDHWGRRKLAYEINNQRDGYYVFITADLDAANMAELERNLKLSPGVLRHLIVRAED